MIKVVEVIPTLSMGGAESMLRDYCIIMDKEKFDVSVIVLTEHKNTPIEDAFEKNGIKVKYLGEQLFQKNDLSAPKRAIRRFSRYYYFRKSVMEINPDVIHLHLQIGKYMRVLPLKKMGCKLYLTVHNVAWRYFSKDRNDRIQYSEYREVYRLIHENGLRLIALQDELNNELKELFETSSERVITLHNGIQMKRFDPGLYDRSEERKRLSIEEGVTVIGHVGSMHPQKNHDLILQVFSEYHKMHSTSRLLLIGNGKLKSQIIEKIEQMGLKQDVTILSDRDDVPQLMRAMDVFLFPSRWEGFGNVLIEAQYMGLPCVVSDVVPKDTRITDRVHVVGLNEPVKTWVKELDNALEGIPGATKQAEPEEYDINRNVKLLEGLYI